MAANLKYKMVGGGIMEDLTHFKNSVEGLSEVGLNRVLDDIKMRIGEAYLSNHGAYLKQQKRRADIVLQELESRSNKYRNNGG